MPISVAGLGSGLDVNSLVSQLMAVERRPLDLLARVGTGLQTTLSAFGRLSGALSTFQDAAGGLATSTKWQVYNAASSDAAVSATAASSALEGSYSLSVSKLAKNHSLVSSTFGSSATVVGSGTITIELGSFAAIGNLFTPNPAKTPTSIVIAPGTDSLAQVRDAINGANAGVTASIANTGTGAKLLLTSKDSGAANAIKLTVNDNDGISNDATGLSQLAFDRAAVGGAGKNLTETQVAQDANFNINGIDIVSATNVVQNAIDGITLTLKQETTSAARIDISKDSDAIRKSVDTFISTYNELNKTMIDLTKYDATSKQGGALQGDRAAVGVLTQIRATIRDTFSGSSGDFTRLSDVGVEQQADGSLKLNATKWEAANASPERVARLFSNIGTTGQPLTIGFAKRLQTIAQGFLNSEGTVTSRTDGIRASITANKKQQETVTGRLELTEKRLRTQYQALDTKLASIQATSAYLTQQISALYNNNRN